MGEAKVGGASNTPGDEAPSNTRPHVVGESDVRDVVEGEVGSSKLVEPSSIPDDGAALDAFQDMDVPDAGPAKDR